MEDVQPSTSKQGQQEDRNDGSGSDRKSNTNNTGSHYSWSHSYSTRSLCDMAEMVLGAPKPELKKGENRTKVIERRKGRRRHTGRVDKSKRSVIKRDGTQRAAKRKPYNRREKRKRDTPISTIFTTLSSNTRSHICQRCGHRCCKRRSQYSFKRRKSGRYERRNRRKIDRKDLRAKKAFKSSVTNISGAAAVQMGSRAYMLSPLFIKSNESPDEHQDQNQMYCEISPEMIYQAVRNLSMWKQEVKTEAILEYIKSHYPIDPGPDETLKDLMEKLRIAALVGIVIPLANDSWCLPTALQTRPLSETHVTIFWHAYVDTMEPFTKEKMNSGARNTEKQTQ